MRKRVQSATFVAVASMAVHADKAELAGRRPITNVERDAALAGLSPGDVRTTAGQVRDNALLMTPWGARPPGTRYSAAHQTQWTDAC